MKKKVICVIVFFLLTVSVQADSRHLKPVTGQEKAFVLLYPPDKSLMELGPLSVSLKVEQGFADRIVAAINGKDLRELVPDSEYVCFSLPLQIGVNAVEIHLMHKNEDRGKIVFSVFRRSDLEIAYSQPPAGYVRNYFHMSEQTVCRDCHNLDPGEHDREPINIAVFSAETSEDKQKAVAATSTCYSCHRAITSFAYVHGPASVWSCLSCHDVGGIPVYAVKKPDTDVCFQCHTEQKNDWTGKKYVHGPVNTGKCAICHSPHASENPFNLFKPTWDLCVSCHAENATGRHILVGYIHRGHPTHEVPDPLREGKELTCASCHNAHASDYPRLWALNVESQFELCMKCHKDKLL